MTDTGGWYVRRVARRVKPTNRGRKKKESTHLDPRIGVCRHGIGSETLVPSRVLQSPQKAETHEICLEVRSR